MANQDNFNNSDDHSAAVDTYDRGIVPAETAARKEREKGAYKKTPGQLGQDESNDPDAIHTTDGYTVDKEGLIDNFPIEPEMYINEPGDLRQEEEAEKAQRAEEMDQVNHNDETGKLTMEKDTRGRGQGLV
ncbi:MAG TPA: hypothetical protein V6C78_13325 [Crinalium sp.]|jgi:hypothetical protein